MIYDKVNYTINENWIDIKKVNTFFKEKHEQIRFTEIRKVVVRQAFYEKDKNIGTIMIYTGKSDDVGNKIYSKLIGIKNYNEIANLIEKKANLMN